MSEYSFRYGFGKHNENSVAQNFIGIIHSCVEFCTRV